MLFFDRSVILVAGSRVPIYTHSKWRDVPRMREFQPGPVVNLNPVDAGHRGIQEGELVIVENPPGSIKAHVHVTGAVLWGGVVDVLHGWPEQDVNTMVPRIFDPISGFPCERPSLGNRRQLVKPLNLTSARWQALTAVAFAGKPLSAPQIAEAMGITRQGAQKQLNKLKKEGFLEQCINPRHSRVGPV